jgi:hypothetical protein
MFCPMRGVEMTNVGGVLTCVPGDMPLSPRMQQSLIECFVDRTRMPRDSASSHQIGGAWFCPGCGVRAEENEGRLVCPSCSRSLNEFVYPLIELHPHRLDEATRAELDRWWAENRRKAPAWPRRSEPGNSD